MVCSGHRFYWNVNHFKTHKGFIDYGTIYAIIGVVSYALIALTSRKLSNKDSAYNLTFYMFLGQQLLAVLGV